LEENRKRARKKLRDLLDRQANPGLSQLDMKIARKHELARRKRKKQKKNLAKRGRTVAKEG